MLKSTFISRGWGDAEGSTGQTYITDEILDREKRPATVREAVAYLHKIMPPQALAELAALPEDQLIEMHYGLAA